MVTSFPGVAFCMRAVETEQAKADLSLCCAHFVARTVTRIFSCCRPMAYTASGGTQRAPSMSLLKPASPSARVLGTDKSPAGLSCAGHSSWSHRLCASTVLKRRDGGDCAVARWRTVARVQPSSTSQQIRAPAGQHSMLWTCCVTPRHGSEAW